MDINDFRGIITAITFVAFVGICVWAFSAKRKADFDTLSKMPLEDEENV